jgi:hypothetical protein
MPSPAPGLLPSPDLLPGEPYMPPPPAPEYAHIIDSHDLPHLAFPVRFVDGVAVTVEQDSPEHKRDRIHNTCRHLIGDRLDDPTFGIPDEVMRVQRADLDAISAAIAQSEPMITVAVSRPTVEQPDPVGLRVPNSRDEIYIAVHEDD